MHSIKINYKKLYETSLLFKDEIENVDEIKTKLTEISDNMKDIWTGDDSHNFLESFNSHINDLENVKNYLTATGELLERISLSQNISNEDFIRNVERCDI